MKQQLDDYSQKAIVLRIQGGPETQVKISCSKPAPCSLSQGLAQLAQSNEMLFTRPFPWESAMLHRVVFNEHWNVSFEFEDEGNGSQVDWYYVRVFQSNGELAWSSPIWIEKA